MIAIRERKEKMIRKVKKAIAQILVVVMLVTILPLSQSAEVKAFSISSIKIGKGDSRIGSMINNINSQTGVGNAATYILHLINTSKYRPKEMGGGKFPYPNSSKKGFTRVSDGTYNKSIWESWGCMSYCYWASKIIYGKDHVAKKYEGEAAGKATANNLKKFIQTYCQAGEHIRVDNTHSVTYISCDNNGFYYLNYLNDSNPYIALEYATYSAFASGCNKIYAKIFIYDANKSVNSGMKAVSMPTISSASIDGGKRVTIGKTGTTTYYSIDGGAYKQYSAPFNITAAGTHTIRAYSTQNGYAQSSVASQTVSVSRAPAPTLSKTELLGRTQIRLTDSNSAAKIYYSINGGAFAKYSSIFEINETATIKCYAVVSGCANSETQTQTVTLTQPAVPTVRLENNSNKIPVGDSAILSWDSISNAAVYMVNVDKGDGVGHMYTTYGTTYTVPLDSEGTYHFAVSATNNFGTSEYSKEITVTAMPKVTVQFQDYDGTPLSEKYSVKYGSSVSAPMAPEREGYTFQGWDGSYNNLTEDKIIKATYERKSFTVTFCDKDGNSISRQRIYWGDKATAPNVDSTIPVGYVFSGWHVDPKSDCMDYEKVVGNMTLYMTYAWKNVNLPVDVENFKVSCTANNSGQFYQASMNLYCNPDEDIRGRVIVEIKTGKGTTKVVGTHDITLKAGQNSVEESFKINSSVDGSIAKVYIVGVDEDGNTSGSMSEVKTTNISREVFYSEWSEWSTTPVTGNDERQVETKTQYRYNTRSTATSTTSKTMSGYNLINTAQNVGAWSSWRDTAVSKVSNDSLLREVQTQSVIASTSYVYGHYCTGNISGAKYQTSWTKNTTNSIFNSRCAYHVLGTFSSSDSRIKTDAEGYCYYPSGSSTKYRCANTCYRWYRMETKHTYKTQYRYRDTTYVYTFEKINPFSEWSDNSPIGSYYQKESRTLYRYRTVTDKNEGNEIDETKTFSLNGKIDAAAGDLSGKVATVMVYKKTNSDPTQSQLEYLEQITIGKGNTYSVDIIPKENPSERTGDFVVSLAIEGSTRLVNVDVIAAPKPSYTVKFMADGKEVSSQTVRQNDSAVIPEAPAVEGKTFVRWDTATTNVIGDLTVEAIYAPSSYTVVYVDDMNGTIELDKADYGEPITREAPKNPAGYQFVGWSEKSVTGDMVVKAKYEKQKYTVTFVDAEGETFDVQTVEYGESAYPRDTSYMIAPAGTRISGWSTDIAWWKVTENMVVYPVVEYEKTVETPYSLTPAMVNYVMSETDIAEEDSPIVELSCDTEKAVIYYTTDGTIPDIQHVVNKTTDNEEEMSALSADGDYSTNIYDEPIEITEDTVVKAVAVADGMNVSEVAELEFKINSDVNSDEWVLNDNGSILPESIALNKSSVSLTKGKTTQLTATVQPTDAQAKDVVWSTSDSKVATVSAEGIVTAKTTGKCDIIATSKINPAISAKCVVTVISQNVSSTNSSDLPKVTKPKKVTKLKVKPGKKSIKISYKWRVENDGYQIQYARNKKFTKKRKVINVGCFTDKKVIKKLKKKTTYYVRVRAYKKDYSHGGTKVYGAWSVVRKVKVKK